MLAEIAHVLLQAERLRTGLGSGHSRVLGAALIDIRANNARAGAGPAFGMAGFQLLPYYEAVRALRLRHFL